MNTIALYEKFKESTGVSIDTRSIQSGNLFFAIKGPNFDGHKYIKAAFDSGAAYAIIDDSDFQNIENTILVKNTVEALQSIAMFHRCMINIPVIGITGSNGKTTTKELVSSVLSTKFNVFSTKGNYNNHLGVPLSILSIDESHEIAIIEMGANNLGEIKFLAEMSMPDIGLITNIGKAHIEGFGSLEGVRKGKTELYQYLKKTKGTILYNEKDENLKKSLPEGMKCISYSDSEVDSVSNYPFVGMVYKKCAIQSNLSGTYNIFNIVAALTIGEYFGLSIEELKKGIESYIPNNNRSQIKETENNTLILDAYNANPSSMLRSIENFHLYPSEKKVLILGHMLELGDSAKSEHIDLIKYISSFDWDQVFLVGSEFTNLGISVPYKVYRDTNDLSAYLKDLKLKGFTILLKGSRGIALEKCVEFL